MYRRLSLLFAFCLLTVAIYSAQAITWSDAEIGAPAVAGSFVEKDGVLTVTGAGTGDTTNGKDQLHYTYTAHPVGDLDVIVRLTGFKGEVKGRAGIMLRSANDADATTANTVFCYQASADKKHSIIFTAYDKDLKNGASSGIATKMDVPIWLRIVRVGKRFAAYKSSNGTLWTMMSNTSGGQFNATGPIKVGIFVASGSAATTATATFDNISIGKPNMGYSTSWYGNNFGSNADDGHVSNGISALFVAPDGTCYTNSGWDEGGEPSKIYKDGKIIKGLREGNENLGNSFCGEGSITSDGKNLYLAVYKNLFKTDLLGTAASTKPIYLSIDPFDEKKYHNIISGLAVVKDEIFISDSRDQKIRVALPTATRYYTAGNTSVNITTQKIDTTGIANAAPAAIYQSQRENDANAYVIPGLTPNTKFNVRCHFAEYTETVAGKRIMNVSASGATTVTNYDVITAAGGPFKPAVLDIPNAQSDATGKLSVYFERVRGGDGHVVICGIEILSTDNKQVFAINCGGPDVAGFKSEINEVISRAFDFTRPGPMTVDSRGDLWIISEANDFPIGTTVSTKYPGVIKCYHPNGKYAGKQITDVVNPVAIAYDAVNDRLLIADNADMNIKIYGNLKDTPVKTDIFGVQGGLFAGKNPGLVNDPAAGGYARFYGITGVGIDANGNIYVSNGMQGTDLRKMTPDGKLVWMMNGLFFCNTPDLDPDTDGTDAYSVYWHGSMDYSKTAPGSEWSFKGYNWNSKLYGDPPRQGNAQSIIRRVGSKRAKILYTSGQGSVEYVGIFRYDGEIAIPCGQIRDSGAQIWIDTNGDGKETKDEVTTGTTPGGMSTFCVDDNGDVWLACMTANTVVARHFKVTGMTLQGAPIYTLKKGDVEDADFPGTGKLISNWGMGASLFYDSARDSMYFSAAAQPRLNEKEDSVNYLARYDDWSTGNRKARWFITLPNPNTSTDFMYEIGRPWGCVHKWMGMDVAADKIFIAELWGQINVFKTTDGSLERILNAGPEVSGGIAWEDAAMGLSAFKRKNGEFIIFSENSGWGGKPNMYRLPASKDNILPVTSITSPAKDEQFVRPTSITITASAVDDDGSVSKVEFYQGTKKLGEDTTKPYSYTWTNIPFGNQVLTVKVSDDKGGITTSKEVKIAVLANDPPKISIYTPINNSSYTVIPASILIGAEATDSDGYMKEIEFFCDGIKLGDTTEFNSGFGKSIDYSGYYYGGEFNWKIVKPGKYILTAKVTDDKGATTVSAPVNILVVKCITTDLVEGLAVGTVADGQNNWKRDPIADGNAGNYGQFEYTNTEGAPVKAPCLKLKATGSSGHMFAYRDLGINTGLSFWKITGDMKFDYSSVDKRTQVRILVKDAADKVIANYERLTWNWGDTSAYVKFNGEVVQKGTFADTTPIDKLCNTWNSFSIESVNGMLTFNYGGRIVTAAPLEGSTIGNPKTISILVGETNYGGQSLYIDNLAFLKAEGK
jgi:sugar lactone lactonase YvrE